MGGGEGGGPTRFTGEETGQEAEAAGPTTSGKTRGRKRSPMLAHRAAVLWKMDLRDSTCWNTVPESQSALEKMVGQRALQMERSPWPRADQRGRGGPRCQRGGRGPRGEAGFLLDLSQGAAVAGDVVEDVTNGVVTANAVPSTLAGEGVVAPPVLGLPAEWANRISVPDCHAKPTPETGGEKGSGEMGVGGVRKGSEPCTGARVAIEDEMGFSYGRRPDRWP